MKIRVFSIVFLLAGLALSGCGGPEVVEVEVRFTDFAFVPSEITFPAGAEVHLTLINDGAVEHELLAVAR